MEVSAPIASTSSPPTSDDRVVMVVGATGSLGGHIVEALLARGVRVRPMVRATSDRSRLEALGITDFVVADLNDPASLRRALVAEPRAAAVIASAAGFSSHSAKTRGDNSKADTEGYRDLIDATRAAGVSRFILISILGCDRAPGVPHFREKFQAEQHLATVSQPYLALRAGAFLDRSRDIVPASIRKGVFPDMLPGVPMALLYSRDLARYAVQAALDLPESALNQSVDIGSDVPATGTAVAQAFAEVLGRPIRAKPVFPPSLFAILSLAALFVPRLREQLAVLRWLRKGGYVSRDPQRQKQLFGDLPSIKEIVSRYCQDKIWSI
ncbi:SDR family oxidoreductase [Sphingomonas sp. UYP23]